MMSFVESMPEDLLDEALVGRCVVLLRLVSDAIPCSIA